MNRRFFVKNMLVLSLIGSFCITTSCTKSKTDFKELQIKMEFLKKKKLDDSKFKLLKTTLNNIYQTFKLHLIKLPERTLKTEHLYQQIATNYNKTLTIWENWYQDLQDNKLTTKEQEQFATQWNYLLNQTQADVMSKKLLDFTNKVTNPNVKTINEVKEELVKVNDAYKKLHLKWKIVEVVRERIYLINQWITKNEATSS